MAISVDGHDAASHDDFRGIPGTFDRAMHALAHARDIGLDTQFQTTVTRRNMGHLPEIAEIVKRNALQDVEPVLPDRDRPRAGQRRPGAPSEYEEVFEYMYNLSKTAPFGIKTTEAMHYRRYIAQRIRAEHGVTENEAAKGVAFRTAGVSDGKGFVFVSHEGEIFPSGFLPVSGGNVLRETLPDVYRNSELFKTLRDTTQREGKCGICEYQKICGGSRVPRFRPHWRLSGRRPALHLPAPPRRRHRIT